MERDAYLELGKHLTQRHADQLLTQLAVFQQALINFGSENGDVIATNDEYRTKFTSMCQLVGVDPLELMVHVHTQKKDDDFFIGLLVRIVEVCQETRDINGGLISMKELVSRLQDNVHLHTNISSQDVTRALSLLNTLGSGFEVVEGKWLKYALALVGISTDHKRVYDVCGFMGGYVTVRLLRDNYGWDKLRCKSVLDEMIMYGFLWFDDQGEEPMYWEPSWS